MKMEGGNPLDGATRYAMQFVISTPIEKLYTFQLSPRVMEEFLGLIKSYRQHNWEHTFKSEEFLEIG